jgi:hypothetical protein
MAHADVHQKTNPHQAMFPHSSTDFGRSRDVVVSPTLYVPPGVDEDNLSYHRTNIISLAPEIKSR